MRTVILTVAGLLVGGYVGFQAMSPHGERVCGLMVLPGVVFGAPVGAFVGALLGLMVGLVLGRFRGRL